MHARLLHVCMVKHMRACGHYGGQLCGCARLENSCTGGRCVRRPSFDFVESIGVADKTSSRVAENCARRWFTQFAVSSWRNSRNVAGRPRAKHRIVAAISRSKTGIMTTLNKLSIDKVDVTGKRVLIRYIYIYLFLITRPAILYELSNFQEFSNDTI